MNGGAPDPAQPDPLIQLAEPGLTLADTLRLVEAVEAQGAQPRQTSVGVSAGSTVDLLGLFLRRQGLLNGVSVGVEIGNYDDPLGDIERFTQSGVEHLVLAPFLDTLAPAFEARLAVMGPDLLADTVEAFRARLKLTLDRAGGFRTVFLSTLHRMGPSLPGGDAVDIGVRLLNDALLAEADGRLNVRIVNMADAIAEVGRRAAFDTRFYYRNRAPYSAALLGAWAKRIDVASRGFGAHYYKALVLDCDNTLWGGVLGEDLIAGVKLDPHDYPGNVFWRVQQSIAAIRAGGALLCLCSKNNPQDVDEMFAQHPQMVLKDEDVVLKQVNWSDKVANLKAIASELDIGLDSLVFLDDSPFECNAVRTQLPMVRVFQVPRNLSEYPQLMHSVAELFIGGGVTGESRDKTEQYRLRAQARAEQAAHESQEDYLASLDMTVSLSQDNPAQIARIAELSQKSNQFNLTTRRYSPAEIEALMADPAASVYALSVRDKFGDSGLTGVVIVRRTDDTASVEAMFMSCRVLGRGVEFAVWPQIVADAQAGGATRLAASYLPTAKNAQAADYYDRLGLPLTTADDTGRRYGAAIDALTFPPTPWIKVTYA